MPKCGAWADCADIAPESNQLVELVLILFGLLMDATQPNKPPMDTKRSGFGVRAAWCAGVIIISILIGLFIASFYLDGILRPRLEARMNASLKGYHVTLGRAHLQLLNLRLTLKQLIVQQDAHPVLPVAEFPMIRFHIHW